MRDVLSRLFGVLLCLAGIAVVVGSGWLAYSAGDWTWAAPGILGLIVIGLGWRRFSPNYFAPLPVAKDDPLMLAAIDEARRDLDRFTAGLDDDATQAFVKFALTAPNGETEHIWGLVHERSGSELTVSLANDPVEDQGSLDAHQIILLNEIEDWMLVGATGDTEGGYTMGAMAAIYKRDRGRVPPPIKAQLRQFKDIDLDGLE